MTSPKPERGTGSGRGGVRAPSSRRARGSGGLTPIGDGAWRVDIEIGRDPVTGHRRRVSRTVRGTRQDAEAALAALRVADHQGRARRPGTSGRTVGAALDAYVADLEAGTIEVAPKTVVTNRSARNTMKRVVLSDGRVFGSVSLSKLGWEEIENLYRAMARRGAQPAWIRRCATVLTQALDRARKHRLIEHNPARDAKRPKLVRKKPRSPQRAQVEDLLQRLVEGDPEIADAVVVFACTGMRMGELLGLQWADLDLDVAVANLAWAISDGGPGVGVVRKELKRADWRDVPLLDAAVDALRGQAERCRARFGVELEPGHYVFPGRGPDLPHRPDTFGERLAKARGASSLTFLDLRHYVATTMLDAGEDYRTVADVLGNSETTLRLHYDGRTNVDKRRAVSALILG